MPEWKKVVPFIACVFALICIVQLLLGFATLSTSSTYIDEQTLSNWAEECIDGTESNDSSVMENTSSTYEPSSQN